MSKRLKEVREKKHFLKLKKDEISARAIKKELKKYLVSQNEPCVFNEEGA